MRKSELFVSELAAGGKKLALYLPGNGRNGNPDLRIPAPDMDAPHVRSAAEWLVL